jgi:hypothetical protein
MSSGGGVGGDQGCRGCHGVEPIEGMPEDSWAAGLRLHHENADAPPDSGGLTCQMGCHAGDPMPLPEDTLPLYYPRQDTTVTDSCDDNLDNDGDLDYDGDDSDCAVELFQVVTSDPIAQQAAPSAMVSFDAIYDTDPAAPNLTGLGLRVHFDSSEVTFDSFSDVFATGLIVNPDLVTPEADTGNEDGDPATDFFVRLAWLDIGGAWPGTLPQTLFTVHFMTAASFSGTQVNYSASDQPPGYSFRSTPALLTAGCTVDADCDDGLFCNGAETCNTGTGECEAGTPVDCDDGVACTDDSCNELTDSCDNEANDANCPDDGLFCTGEEFCDAVQDCLSTGDPCLEGETCNEDEDICEAPQQAVLAVIKEGTGSGTVASNPAGIDCGMDCMESYIPGTDVTLTATRDSGSTFDGWGGDCSGTLTSTSVVMNADRTCTAAFEECVAVKDVSDRMISDQQAFEACNALMAGNFQILGPGGEVTFTAGEEIILLDGFAVGSNATFTAVIDPSLIP